MSVGVFAGGRRALPQRGELELAPHDLEARIHQLDAIEQRLELAGLVLHVHGRRHLAAVVQQRRDAQLVALGVGERELLQRSLARRAGRVGDQLGEDRHATAVLAGVGRLLVDRLHDQLDQPLEERAELAGQAVLRERHGGLRGERLREREALGLEAAGPQQLQHADELPLVVPHRDRELAARRLVHGGAGQRGVLGQALEASRAILLVRRVPLEQQVTDEAVLRVAERERAGAGVGDAHRAAQDRGEQALGVLLHGERAAHRAHRLDHRHVVLDVRRHRVERFGELLELVARLETDARGEVARRHAAGGELELLDRHEAASHEHERGEAHGQQREQRDQREHGAEAVERREQRGLRLGQLDRPGRAAELRPQEQVPRARPLHLPRRAARRRVDGLALGVDEEVDTGADGVRHEQEAGLDLRREQAPAGRAAQQRDARRAAGLDAQQRAARVEMRPIRGVELRRLAQLDVMEALREEGGLRGGGCAGVVDGEAGLEQQQPLEHRHAELLRVLLEACRGLALDLSRHLLEGEHREAERRDERAREHQEEDATRHAAGEEAPVDPTRLGFVHAAA